MLNFSEPSCKSPAHTSHRSCRMGKYCSFCRCCIISPLLPCNSKLHISDMLNFSEPSGKSPAHTSHRSSSAKLTMNKKGRLKDNGALQKDPSFTEVFVILSHSSSNNPFQTPHGGNTTDIKGSLRKNYSLINDPPVYPRFTQYSFTSNFSTSMKCCKYRAGSFILNSSPSVIRKCYQAI